MNKFLLALALIGVCLVGITHLKADAGGGPISLGVQTSLAGCQWPTNYVTVANGAMLCPLLLEGQPALALAVNGGPFYLIETTATTVSCTTANLTKAGVLNASGCTFK